jgi:hypothetical protein
MELEKIDYRRILTIYLFVPTSSQWDLGNAPIMQTQEDRRRITSGDTLHMGTFIDAEWNAEAGNMLVLSKSFLYMLPRLTKSL